MASVVIPSSKQKYEYNVPRSFKLRQELEFAEKGIIDGSNNKARDPHQGYISFGLHEQGIDETYETQLCLWQATIFGPQGTPLQDRMYSLNIKADKNYPSTAPIVYFLNRINMPCVDQTTGLVLANQLRWSNDQSIYTYLQQLRTKMFDVARLRQPGPNEMFPPPSFNQ